MPIDSHDPAEDTLAPQSPEQKMRLQALGMLLNSYDEAIAALTDAIRATLASDLQRVNREILLYLCLALAGGVGAIHISRPILSIGSSLAFGAGIGALQSIYREYKEIRTQLAVIDPR